MLYEKDTGSTARESHTITVLVDNEAGVLARVVGLFSGRGYNIESLTVAEAAGAAINHNDLTALLYLQGYSDSEIVGA